MNQQSVTGDDFKELVRGHTDIVGLIGEKVALRPESGGKYKGLCPFHEDSNPSFTVSPDYGSYKCWACNEAGDAFSFVMKMEKLDFRGALELLARRAGLEMPTYGRPQTGPKRDEQIAAMDWANEQFVNALWDGVAGEAARDYFRGRDFSDETLEQWGLGFHPENWTFLLDRARNNFSIEVLEAARLVKKSERSGDWLDQFVGRVMFPIRNDRGQIVAFGGRVLPSDDGNERGPKYLNSSESPYFSKQKILYGLDVAKHHLESAGRAIVVEGYTDCITLHQHGITNAVGVLGTALTEHHARLLKRFTSQIVLIFDGDAAGQKAAERSLGTLLTSDLDVRVMTLPNGVDPDEFLAEYGPEELQHRAGNAPEAWRWKFDQAVSRHGLESLDGRNRVLDEMLTVLVNVSGGSNVRLDMLLATVAQRVGVGEDSVRKRLNDIRRQSTARTEQYATPQKVDPTHGRIKTQVDRIFERSNRDDRIEVTLLEELLATPEHFSVASSHIVPDDFRNEALGKLFHAMSVVAQGLRDHEGNTSQSQFLPNYENVMAKLTHPELKRLLVALHERVVERHGVVPPSSQFTPAGAEPVSAAIDFPDACPPFLRRPIEQMHWRREEQSHQQLARQLEDSNGGLQAEEAGDVLLRLAQFRKQRNSGGTR